MKTIRVGLLPWQKQVWRALKGHRYVVISAGRQSGKTTFCLYWMIIKALSKQGSINWWVSPQYSTSKIALRRTKILLRKNGIPFKESKKDYYIELPNGATIWFKSAENEGGLRGETLDALAVDEMGLIKKSAWEEALRGTVAINEAPVIFIGTPKGKNIFYELFSKGIDPLQFEYTAFQFSSDVNPYFSQHEWDEVKLLPQRVFEQEYQAQFIDDGGEVFRNIKGCIKGKFEPAVKGLRYIAGIDLAKTYDYTVVSVFKEIESQDDRLFRHLVAFDRFNGISWGLQKERIIKTVKQYDALAVIDSTGVGDPVVEDLEREIRCEGVVINNTNKRQMIEQLSMDIEQELISFPEIPELINELNVFTFEQTKTGKIRYGAPDGMHDDIVMSMALGNSKFGNEFHFAAIGPDGEMSMDDVMNGMYKMRRIQGRA